MSRKPKRIRARLVRVGLGGFAAIRENSRSLRCVALRATPVGMTFFINCVALRATPVGMTFFFDWARVKNPGLAPRTWGTRVVRGFFIVGSSLFAGLVWR